MHQYTEDELATYDDDKSSGGGGGGNSNGCFPAGTMICTPAGLRDIATLKAGEEIQSYDFRSGNLRTQRILKKARHENNRLWQITIEDGAVARTTAVHSFRVGGRWKQAKQIVAGDELVRIGAGGQKSVRVLTCEPSAKSCEVFNLIVEGGFTFIADGVVVHSFTHCRLLRMFLWWGRGVMLRYWPQPLRHTHYDSIQSEGGWREQA